MGAGKISELFGKGVAARCRFRAQGVRSMSAKKVLVHIPIMLRETAQFLNLQRGGHFFFGLHFYELFSLTLGFPRSSWTTKRAGFHPATTYHWTCAWILKTAWMTANFWQRRIPDSSSRPFGDFGEERHWRKIIALMLSHQGSEVIKYADTFAECIAKKSPQKSCKRKIQPATRIFQTLRIAVNGELEEIRVALPKAFE